MLLRHALTVGLFATVSLGLASPWTVQVVATANASAARQLSEDFRQQGLPAYVTSHDGLHRVRLGCFGLRADAEAMARQAKAWGVQNSIVLSAGSLVTDEARCVQSQVGFVKPADWQFVDGEQVPLFEVRLADTAASISYAPDRGWSVHQVGEPIASTTSAAPSGVFVNAEGTAEPYIAFDDGTTKTLVCPGTLVTSVGQAAIVENDHSVRACRLGSDGVSQP